MHPVIISFGWFCLYSYGLMVALGILIASWLLQRAAIRQGLSAETVLDVIFWVVLCGLAGGRLLYVLLNIESYRSVPWEIIKLYKGGLVFQGSFIAGLAAAVAFIKKNRLPLLKTLDLFAVYLPLAHAFGRVGCFLNGCCFGRPTHLPWGVMFPDFLVPVHPTQLYSAFFLVLIFAVLRTGERAKRFDGQMLFSYLMLYGAMRFVMEFFRGDNPAVAGGLSVFQYISAGMFLSGITLFGYYARKQPGKTS
ncbi:MAG: prolipoprotein diacylglyceryl transferase [Candidatus Omnitrophica bacterium]|nr:prolipoprotein diacylglyceryl transferase [Candidatus Omnitrophota bacterium]